MHRHELPLSRFMAHQQAAPARSARLAHHLQVVTHVVTQVAKPAMATGEFSSWKSHSLPSQ